MEMEGKGKEVGVLDGGKTVDLSWISRRSLPHFCCSTVKTVHFASLCCSTIKAVRLVSRSAWTPPTVGESFLLDASIVPQAPYWLVLELSAPPRGAISLPDSVDLTRLSLVQYTLRLENGSLKTSYCQLGVGCGALFIRRLR